MTTTSITLRARFAWWVRPVLAIAFGLAHLSAKIINSTVDRGITYEVE